MSGEISASAESSACVLAMTLSPQGQNSITLRVMVLWDMNYHLPRNCGARLCTGPALGEAAKHRAGAAAITLTTNKMRSSRERRVALLPGRTEMQRMVVGDDISTDVSQTKDYGEQSSCFS